MSLHGIVSDVPGREVKACDSVVVRKCFSSQLKYGFESTKMFPLWQGENHA